MTDPAVILSSSRASFWWGYLLIIALTLSVFYPVYSAQFNWDDDGVIAPQNLTTTNRLIKIWTKPGESILQDYMPINYTVAWAEYQLWGMNPRGYHLVNLFLHIVNALVLLHLLRRMAFPGALLVALLFAIHPMQASTVAWISQQKNLLFTLFYLLAFFPWLRLEEKKNWKNYALVAVLFLTAMLSKRMAISWPIAAFLFTWWRAGRVDFRRSLFLVALLAVGILLSFIVPLCAPPSAPTPAQYQVFSLSLVQKFLLAGHNLFF
ncbi:TPA: hypothetical protein DDW35_12135, partial [Candidatus Sumerlaeota bacterium]|nr:hypothetical protein [Candidatus Sumerlaeota bacterium]